VTVVELVGGSIGVPALAKNEDVVAAAEGVGEESDGAEVDVGVSTGSLAGGGTVEVPLGELVNGGGLLGESLWRMLGLVILLLIVWLVVFTWHPAGNSEDKQALQCNPTDLGFTPESVGSVNPNVFSLDSAVLGQVHVLLQLLLLRPG
jgi:hypothetical protein